MKVRGPLGQPWRDGGCRAVDGHGIALRLLWDVATLLHAGQLAGVARVAPGGQHLAVKFHAAGASAKVRV